MNRGRPQHREARRSQGPRRTSRNLRLACLDSTYCLVGDERRVRDGAVTRVEATAFRGRVQTDVVYMCYRSFFSFLFSHSVKPKGVIRTCL